MLIFNFATVIYIIFKIVQIYYYTSSVSTFNLIILPQKQLVPSTYLTFELANFTFFGKL